MPIHAVSLVLSELRRTWRQKLIIFGLSVGQRFDKYALMAYQN